MAQPKRKLIDYVPDSASEDEDDFQIQPAKADDDIVCMGVRGGKAPSSGKGGGMYAIPRSAFQGVNGGRNAAAGGSTNGTSKETYWNVQW